MRLEKSITQDKYDKKAYELKQRQYEIIDKLKRVMEADETYSITLINLLNICSRAPEFNSSGWIESILSFISLGTNSPFSSIKSDLTPIFGPVSTSLDVIL